MSVGAGWALGVLAAVAAAVTIAVGTTFVSVRDEVRTLQQSGLYRETRIAKLEARVDALPAARDVDSLRQEMVALRGEIIGLKIELAKRR